MKKLFITFTIMISSFFFCTFNVDAATYEYSIKETDFDYINSDFITVRNYAINYASENNCYYVIYYSNSMYKILFHKNFANKIDTISAGNYIMWKWNNYTSIPVTIIKYDNGNFDIESTNTSSNYTYSISITSKKIDYYNFLDTNYTGFYISHTIILSYNDYSYTINSTSGFPGLYQIYTDIYGEYEEPDVHLEEKEIITNFYITVINKISYLAESISSNYIYLSIIGIFILIFLIELIRRYL